jgi:signal transduction histidine kinase
LVPEIHPSALSDLGLAEAFEEVADRSPLKVTILVDLEGRLPRVIEPAAYFIGAEALWQLMVKL